MNADRVLVVVSGLGTLALTREAFEAALAEGSRAIAAPVAAPSPIAGDEPLVDAEQLAQQLTIPQTWIEQAAREGRIPSIQAGRWRRFRRSDVERALASGKGGTA